MVDELAGLRGGHINEALGPSREKVPNRYTLMSLVGALGLAVQLVEDQKPYAAAVDKAPCRPCA